MIPSKHLAFLVGGAESFTHGLITYEKCGHLKYTEIKTL